MPLISIANAIATVAALIALVALITALATARAQRRTERQRYVAQLHETWWSDGLDTKRQIVWRERENWLAAGKDSPAIRHYARQGGGWPVDSDENQAHARVLFFFADLNALLRHNLIDEDIAFEMFGVAQYDWFRDYFTAIRAAISGRDPKPERESRFVAEMEEFERRLDAWKLRKRISRKV